jgi:hypothetical protein
MRDYVLLQQPYKANEDSDKLPMKFGLQLQKNKS